MPSFERLHRSLMLQVHQGDPVTQEKLRYGFKQRDRGRLEVAALFLIVYILFVVALQIGGGITCTQIKEVADAGHHQENNAAAWVGEQASRP